jgi:hypothetical protein
MATDTKGRGPEREGKRVRMHFVNGEVCEMKLCLVEVHENCQFCDGYAWFVYDVISTNRPELYKILPGNASFAGRFEDIEHFEVLAE